jgi:hypothetical protein
MGGCEEQRPWLIDDERGYLIGMVRIVAYLFQL